jgi:UDPglucose 6-dehydrogenase
MRITMVGTGMSGSCPGACFAGFGHEVTCVDHDEAKIAALRRGEIPIYEPGLEALVVENAHAGRLTCQRRRDFASAGRSKYASRMSA